MYKLLIVDDEPLVQVGIKSMVNWASLDVEVIGSAMNGQIALEIINSQHPDIVISDIKMPVMDGLELLKNTREKYGNITPVFIMLTSYEDFHMVQEAMKYQAFNYLLKLELTADALSEVVLKAISYIQETAPNNLPESVASANAYTNYSFREKFLISVLNNLFEDSEQMQLQAQDLNLDINYAGYICCYGSVASSNIPSALDMLEKLISKHFTYYLTDLDSNHFALLICYREPDPEFPPDSRELQEKLQKYIYEILTLINTSLKNYLNANINCGIGNFVSSISEVSESFQYSRAAYRRADEDNPICYINMQDNLTHDVFNMSLFSGNLIRAFEEYSSELLTATIDNLIELISEHPDHYVQAIDAASNILYLSISLLKDGEKVLSELFANNPDGYMSLYRANSVAQIVNWLNIFSSQLSELFDQRRKDYKNRTVMDVKDFINSHILERISLNEVAAQFGISPSYLSQLFSKYNDVGFSEYINQCKVNKAKDMLVNEGYKIYEVADALSFGSEFYFSKVFKKIEGISPSEFLNKINR